MHYNNLYSIIKGLDDDFQEITESINRMDERTSKTNESHPENNVTMSHNGTNLFYKLCLNDKEIEGKIPFITIYNSTRDKHDVELENAICDLIERDAISKYFG